MRNMQFKEMNKRTVLSNHSFQWFFWQNFCTCFPTSRFQQPFRRHCRIRIIPACVQCVQGKLYNFHQVSQPRENPLNFERCYSTPLVPGKYERQNWQCFWLCTLGGAEERLLLHLSYLDLPAAFSCLSSVSLLAFCGINATLLFASINVFYRPQRRRRRRRSVSCVQRATMFARHQFICDKQRRRYCI